MSEQKNNPCYGCPLGGSCLAGDPCDEKMRWEDLQSQDPLTPTQHITYLASPYSSPFATVRECRFQLACKAAAILMQRGRIVYSPIAHTHPIAKLCDLPKGWDFWQRYDEAFLNVCSDLLVLKLFGWEESVGVQAEIAIMSRLGKPVEYVTLEALLGRKESVANA